QREVCRHRSADLRSLPGSAGALRRLHDQLEGEHLDGSRHGGGAEEGDGDLREVPAAQAPEHGLRRADRDLEVPEVRMVLRNAEEGGRVDLAAYGELTVMAWPPVTRIQQGDGSHGRAID